MVHARPKAAILSVDRPAVCDTRGMCRNDKRVLSNIRRDHPFVLFLSDRFDVLSQI